MSQSASELVEMIKDRDIKLPEDLMVISKWNILQVLIPNLTKEKIKNQKKNYAKLAPESMLHKTIECVIRMFLFIVYDDGRKDLDTQVLKTRTFHQLIKNKIEECEELEEELENIKDEKGFVKEEDYDDLKRETNKEIKRLTEENEKHSARLKQQEEYYKEKLNAVEDRVRAKLEMEFKCRESALHTPPELS
jgi:hypothetical protein